MDKHIYGLKSFIQNSRETQKGKKSYSRETRKNGDYKPKPKLPQNCEKKKIYSSVTKNL